MRIFKNVKFLSILAVAVLGSTLLILTQAAGSASFTLSPSSGSYEVNKNFTIILNVNSGSDTINVVETYLNYDAAKLQFVSINNSSTAFDGQVDNTGGGGSVHITRYKSGSPVSGTKEISRITFKTLAGSGSSSITFGSGSHIVRSTDSTEIWNGVSTGATYSFTTPTPAPPPSTTPPPTNTNTTNNPPAQTNNTTQTDTSTPPTTNNNSAEIPVDIYASSGYLVAIKVVDADNQPVVNQKVSLNGQSSTTDQTGIASFTNIAAGSYEVTVTTKNGKTLASIIVAENSSVSDVQQFEVNIKNKKSTLLYALIPLILITVFIIIWISSRHRSKNELDRHFPLKQTDPNPKASSAIGRIAGGKIYDAGETIQPNVEPKKTETPEVNK